MMTISQEYLQRVTGGAGEGHGPGIPNGTSACEFHAIERASRRLDDKFPFGSVTEDKRTEIFRKFKAEEMAAAKCPPAKRR